MDQDPTSTRAVAFTYVQLATPSPIVLRPPPPLPANPLPLSTTLCCRPLVPIGTQVKLGSKRLLLAQLTEHSGAALEEVQSRLFIPAGYPRSLFQDQDRFPGGAIRKSDEPRTWLGQFSSVHDPGKFIVIVIIEDNVAV